MILMVTDKINILMVDDRPQNLLALEAVLKNAQYNLISATSGEEALKYVLLYDFAVILLDVQMPGMNGFDTARLIQKREKSKNIPIIFITAINKASEHVLQGYSVGAVDYIFKPFDPEALKMKISTFVKLYKSHKDIEVHSKLLEQRTYQLEEAYTKLEHTTSILMKTEALARVIGETSTDSIFTVDEKGKILRVNPSAESMFGYDKQELIGQQVDVIMDEKTVLFRDGNTAKINGKLTKIESKCLRKDKSRFYAQIQIGQASVENQIVYIIFVRDVTELKKIEQERERQYEMLEKLVDERTKELSSSESRFRRVFESSPNLMSIKSVREGRHINVNQSWQTYTGYSLDEVKDRSLRVFYPLHDEFDEKELLQNVKVKYYRKGGIVRYGLMSTERIELEGEQCVLTVVTDITETILLEKEITRLDRLFLVGEMAAGIAHEIRNPMTTVHGFLQTLEGKILSSEHVNLMLEELKRANDIITEFLSLAKNKRCDLQLQDINSIVVHLLPLIEAEGLRQDKYLDVQLKDCPELKLDEKEIRQVILNLALNGLEATEAGGRISIKTYLENNEVVLEINDHGSGIKEEIIDKIGTPFFTTKDNGTGLGLAVCYSVAARHNATVTFKTGKTGTAFYVRFKTLN